MLHYVGYIHVFQRVESIHVKQMFPLFLNNYQLFSFLYTMLLSWKEEKIEVNKSQYIALLVVNRSIEKVFLSYLFSIFFFNRSWLVEKCWVTPYCSYCVWLVDFKEYQNMHENICKYTFLNKVFYHRIVSACLLSDGFCSNFKRCFVQNKSTGDTLMPKR